MRRPVIMISVAAATLAVIGATAAFSHLQPAKVVPVTARTDVAARVYGLGTIEARVLSKVGFEVTGTLAEVAVDEGDLLPAGTVLARLDVRRQNARVEQTKAETARAQANLEQAGAQLKRARALLAQRQSVDRRKQSLVRSGTATVQAAEDARTEVTVAEADVAVAESNRQVAASALNAAEAAARVERALLDLYTITSATPAIVVDRIAEPGAVMVPGQTVLTLADPQSIWAEIYVDEASAGGLAVGLPVQLALRSRPGEEFAGSIARLGVEGDRIGGERRVYVAFDRIPDHFTLGELAEGFITLEDARILSVPAPAIASRDGRPGVWLVDGDRARWQGIVLGRTFADGRREVLGGLAAGDRMISRPSSRMADGSRIQLAERAQ